MELHNLKLEVFPCGSTGKECLQCRRPGFDPWVGKIAWRRERLPNPIFWPRELIAWGHKESDTTEKLSLPLSLSVGPPGKL